MAKTTQDVATTKQNNKPSFFNKFINYDTYERIMLTRQYNRLYKKNLDKRMEDLKITENKRIYNLSIKDIAKNFSNTIIFKTFCSNILYYYISAINAVPMEIY